MRLSHTAKTDAQCKRTRESSTRVPARISTLVHSCPQADNTNTKRRAALLQLVGLAGLPLTLSQPREAKSIPLAPLGKKRASGEKTPLPLEELQEVLRRDLGERMYIVTGDLSPEVFDDNCRFKDPTNDVTGLSRYKTALGILFDPSLSKVILDGISVTGPNTIEADYTAAGWLKKELFPWQPKVPPYKAHLTYTIGDNGLIVMQDQTWSISAAEALRETFTPNFGPREPLL